MEISLRSVPVLVFVVEILDKDEFHPLIALREIKANHWIFQLPLRPGKNISSITPFNISIGKSLKETQKNQQKRKDFVNSMNTCDCVHSTSLTSLPFHYIVTDVISFASWWVSSLCCPICILVLEMTCDFPFPLFEDLRARNSAHLPSE